MPEKQQPRFELIDKDGKKYAPFRLKPGVQIHQILKGVGPDLELQVVGS